jgi:hypothetical protein
VLYPLRNLSADVQYLLAHDIEPSGWNRDCDKCGCPISRVYLVNAEHLGVRCASCGVPYTRAWGKPLLFSLRDDVDVLHRFAEEARWDQAIAKITRRLGGIGGWWDLTVGLGAWRSRRDQ